MSSEDGANLVLFLLSVAVGVFAWRRSRARGKRFFTAPGTRALKWYPGGIVLGGAAIAAGCLLLVALGRAHLGAGNPRTGEITSLIVYFLVLALVEEFVFRGLLLRGIAELTNRTSVAVGLSAVLVAVPYLLGEHVTPLTVISAVLAGVMYGTAYVVTGSILTSAGMRMAWNVVQGPVLGFLVSGDQLTRHPILTARLDGPDWLTGGGYGPEGGVIVIVGRLLVIALLLALVRRGPRSKSAAQA